MIASAVDRRIRSLRPPKLHADPYVAHGALVEQERRPDGKIEQALTVFLTGAECPFTCSFCDLWLFTIDGPSPPGALTAPYQPQLIGETRLADSTAPTMRSNTTTAAANHVFIDPRSCFASRPRTGSCFFVFAIRAF